MKFSEVPAQNLSLRVKPLNGETIKGFEKNSAAPEKGSAMKFIDVLSVKSTHVHGEFELYLKDSLVTVAPVVSADINKLASVLASGHFVLSQLTDPAPDGSATLHLLLFPEEPMGLGSLEIGVDDDVLKSLSRFRKKGEVPISIEEAAKTLWAKCVLKHGGKTYFFIVAGEAARTYLDADAAAEEEEDGPEKPEQEKAAGSAGSDDNPDRDEENDDESDSPADQVVLRNFAVLGSDIRFALAEKDKGNRQTIFLVSKITRIRNRREDPALRLVNGNLVFTDWTKTGECAQFVRIQLDRITETAGSYLRKWDEFGNVEGELFLERARRIGAIPFTVVNEDKDGLVTVQCGVLSAEQKKALQTVTELDAVRAEDLPIFLNDPNVTFDEFAGGIAKAADYEDFLGIPRKKERQESGKKKALTLDVFDFNEATGELILKTKDSIDPDLSMLIYSVNGDIAQIERRMRARRKIQTGRAAIPNLGLLIEENGKIPPSQPLKRKMPALTAFVKQKVFPKNPPTDIQERAIEVALNTPDIALIQGPPGTGKTTVIAAIIERLNQEADKREGMSGRILLSGFQHDAVENMTDRLTINGLPVPKFGKRSGAEEEDFSKFETSLLEWCQARTEALREKNPQISECVEESGLRALCVQYIKAPTLKLAIHMLNRAMNLPEITIGEDLRRRLRTECKRLELEQSGGSQNDARLLFVRGLRTKEASFADDGPARATDVLYELKDELDEQDRDLLSRAGRWSRTTEAPPFLNELRELKGKLLMRYTPAPVFRQEKTRDTVVALIRETIDAVRKNGLNSRDKKSAALAELLMEMESDLPGMMETVKDYSYAFAVTCQQSLNEMMQTMKGIRPDEPGQTLEYDYVIVDEAARVSPRDLMIPMFQGKHIILVGDHRQLPQLIDEEVAHRMENEGEDGENESADATINDWLSKSMFEYLFTERLEKLEQADGIQRRVTLNVQFRTHPLLGDFISRNFYERYNAREAFTSGLPEKYFAHNLSGTDGKCAVWLNVRNGSMSKSGTSFVRMSEVSAICERLKMWIEEDNKRTDKPEERLSFGVIAFYKAQAERIRNKLDKKFLDSVGEKRLRIGTVDSFQGMEFDVVFLSLVRTGTRGFGFMKLYNRLNVSMSRQKKLLVVVGDADFYSTPKAKKDVPGLADFLTLCREKGVVENYEKDI